MSILLHITFALLSIGLVTWSMFQPSRRRLFFSYGTIAATIVSGVLLVVTMPASMLHTCITGLIYLAVVVPMSAYATRTLRARS